MRHKKKIIYVGVLVFVLTCGMGIVYAVERSGDNGNKNIVIIDSPERTGNGEHAADSEEPVFCTMDVKKCSDGSYVSRQGPDCKFAPCPSKR